MERHLEKTGKTGEEVDAKIKAGEAEIGETPQSETQEKPLEALTKTQLIEKITALKELSDKNYDLYLRSQAEMENMKKSFTGRMTPLGGICICLIRERRDGGIGMLRPES